MARSAPTPRRLAWLTLLVAALFARGLAPEGWMPSAGKSGIELVACNGMAGGAMAMTADGKAGHDAPDHGSRSEHPCAFAGMNIADTAPLSFAVAVPPALVRGTPALPSTGAMPGHGLAAPPPPATGPPAFA